MKSWLVRQLRQLLLRLDPPAVQYAGAKKVTVKVVETRAWELHSEAIRNRLQYQGHEHIIKYVFAGLQKEFPQVKLQTLDNIVRRVCE